MTNQSLEMFSKLTNLEVKHVYLTAQIDMTDNIEILGVHYEAKQLHSVSIKIISEFGDRVVLVKFKESE